MKVRIEFQEPGESQDDESLYSSVEFTTIHAESIESWGDAVRDFVRPANWRPDAILLSALMGIELDIPMESPFLRKNRDGILALRDELSRLLGEDGGS